WAANLGTSASAVRRSPRPEISTPADPRGRVQRRGRDQPLGSACKWPPGVGAPRGPLPEALLRGCVSRGNVDNGFMTWLLDGGVILAYFITVIGIGLYKGRGDKTMEGFAVGNRSIPWLAVFACIVSAC